MLSTILKIIFITAMAICGLMMLVMIIACFIGLIRSFIDDHISYKSRKNKRKP